MSQFHEYVEKAAEEGSKDPKDEWQYTKKASIFFQEVRKFQELKSDKYPFNPLEGLREGETKAQLKAKALEDINSFFTQNLRCVSWLEDWEE